MGVFTLPFVKKLKIIKLNMGIGLALLIGGIVSSIASITSTLFTNNQSLSNQHDVQNFNAEQAQIQREWESPANQMKLYQEAGINPSMAAQGITGVTGSGAMAQSSQGAPVMPMDWSFLQNAVNDYYSNKNLEAMANQTNKETGWIDTLNSKQQKLLTKQIEESESRKELNDSQRRSIDNAAEQLVRMNDENVKKIQADTNNVIAFTKKIEAETSKIGKEENVLDKDLELKDKSIEKMNAEISNINQQTNESKSKETLNYQLLQESAAKIGLVETETLLKNKEIDLTQAKYQEQLSNAIIADYKAINASYGFYPDSGWINNIMSYINTALKFTVNGTKDNYESFNNSVNDMFSKIINFFSGINKGINEYDSTKNVYGKSWENPNRTTWYNE